MREHWTLEEGLTFLNHGSFGATPRAVLVAQARLRERLEQDPVDFFERFFPAALDAARVAVAAFVGADPDGLAFVPNASTGVATVLSNLRLGPGDELLTTDHTYGACKNALAMTAERSGARVVTVHVPFPGTTADAIVDAIVGAVTPRTRFALLDHVTSPTGLVFPLGRLLPALAARGVDVLIDGAHGPGMVDVDLAHLASLGLTYYTGNGHKWPCAPKGAALLWVHRARRDGFHPLVVSHGLTAPVPPGSTRFRLEHDWTGTFDPSAILSWPTALDYVGALDPGGWPAIRARNRALTRWARERLCEVLGVPEPCDAELIAGLATVPIDVGGRPERSADEIHLALRDTHRVQVPVFDWNGRRFLRIAPHLYSDLDDVERLVAALVAEGLAARG